MQWIIGVAFVILLFYYLSPVHHEKVKSQLGKYWAEGFHAKEVREESPI